MLRTNTKKMCLKRSFCTKIDDMLEVLAEKLHEKLVIRKIPRITLQDIQSSFDVNYTEAQRIQKTYRHVLMEKAASNMTIEEKVVYLPIGSILNRQILDWCGGIFDGDGCVTFEQYSVCKMQVKQNSNFVHIFEKCFGETTTLMMMGNAGMLKVIGPIL